MHALYDEDKVALWVYCTKHAYPNAMPICQCKGWDAACERQGNTDVLSSELMPQWVEAPRQYHEGRLSLEAAEAIIRSVNPDPPNPPDPPEDGEEELDYYAYTSYEEGRYWLLKGLEQPWMSPARARWTVLRKAWLPLWRITNFWIVQTGLHQGAPDGPIARRGAAEWQADWQRGAWSSSRSYSSRSRSASAPPGAMRRPHANLCQK